MPLFRQTNKVTRSIRCSFLTKGKRWTSHIVRERSIMSQDNGRQRVGRKHKQWFPQQQFNPLALKPDTKWTKARRLARINPWIWRLSKKKKKKEGKGRKKKQVLLYKKVLYLLLKLVRPASHPQPLFVTGLHVPEQTSTSLSSARHLRGQLMPFRSTLYRGGGWWEGSSTCWNRDLTTV